MATGWLLVMLVQRQHGKHITVCFVQAHCHFARTLMLFPVSSSLQMVGFCLTTECNIHADVFLVSWHVDIVAGNYPMCCCWRQLLLFFKLLLSFSLSFTLGSPHFPVCSYVVRSEISIRIILTHLSVTFSIANWEYLWQFLSLEVQNCHVCIVCMYVPFIMLWCLLLLTFLAI